MASGQQDGAEDSDEAGPSYQSKRPKISRSTKAGLIFPVGRINRFLRNGNYADRIRSGASVYMAAVLQYLVSEIVDTAVTTASRDRKHRISPKHLQWTINNDEELHRLLGHIPEVQTCSNRARKTQIAASSKKGKGKKSGKTPKRVSARV